MLYQLFSDESGMPARAAGDNDEPARPEQTLAMVDHRAEHHTVVVGHQPATHAVAKTLGLVEDFLEHEVGELALVEHAHVHVYLFHVGVDMLLAQVHDVDGLSRLAYRHLLVVDVDHMLGVFGNGSGVRGDEELSIVLADADDHGRPFAGCDKLRGIAPVDNSDGVGADALAERMDDSLGELALALLLHVFDELHQHFRVGLALEVEAFLL